MTLESGFVTVFFLGVAAWIILFFGAYWTKLFGAPWWPTPRRTVREMLRMAEVGPGDIVYDLGSGDGRVLAMAVREFGARAVGIEISPVNALASRLLLAARGCGGRAKVRWADMYKTRLSEATVVTMFLLQETNERLEEKLRSELRPGARVVSYCFTFKGWAAEKSNPDLRIYMYRA